MVGEKTVVDLPRIIIGIDAGDLARVCEPLCKQMRHAPGSPRI
jgi:hypothetical protein